MKLTRRQKEQRERAKRQGEEVARRWDMDALTPAQLVALLESEEPHVHGTASDRLIARGPDAVESLMAGMAHPERKMRATCALLLDHVADDRCIAPLLHAMRHDPHESVRRCAMHSLVCDGCKECPLNTDVVGALIEAALNDRSRQVRQRAVFYLSQQHPDTRAVPALQTLLARETDSTILMRARRALKRHSML
ncbi:MAG: HEAT repeat domain-containing protein [Armatimonadetes bacterium]|nr:HEAT repeat domain-containing protein [Armatimonadota bacterium]